MMWLPSFTGYGYKNNGTPYWTDIPEVSRGVRELRKCGCKTGCIRMCKCKPLPCTELCACKGECTNDK